jgi:hypothetical protein
LPIREHRNDYATIIFLGVSEVCAIATEPELISAVESSDLEMTALLFMKPPIYLSQYYQCLDLVPLPIVRSVIAKGYTLKIMQKIITCV